MNNYISDIKAAIGAIKKHVNILTVATDELGPAPKKGGKDSFWCCFLHGENTPSMGVHEGMQSWRCFGCHESGDVISFIQKLHSLSLVETLRYLAVKNGLDLTPYERPPTAEELQRFRYTSICDEAASQCSKFLFKSKYLQWYLDDTGFTLEQVADYDVGYSPAGDELLRHLFTKFPDLTGDEVSTLEFGSKLLWSDSLVYPVRSADGHVARFYNKPFSPPPDFGGKYVGTSTKHPLFTNRLIYGFSLIKKDLKKNNFTIRLAEGQKAAIASGGCGVMGTSIHDGQIELLKEYGIKKAIVCFDGDSAGRAASSKLIDDVSKYDGINLLIATIPTDTQADGLAKALGKATLDTVYDGAVTPIEFFTSNQLARRVLTLSDKQDIINSLRGYFSTVSPFHVDIGIKYLAGKLDVDVEALRTFVGELKLTNVGLVNKDLESVVLKTVLLDSRVWAQVKQNITDVKAFTSSGYQYLFGAIKATHEKALKAGLRPEDVTVQSIKDEIALLFPYKELPGIVDGLLTHEQKYNFNEALLRVVDLWRRRVGIEQSKLFASSLGDMNKTTPQVVSEFRRQLVSSVGVSKNEAGSPDLLAIKLKKELHERSLRGGAIIGHDFSKLIDVDGQEIMCLQGLTIALSGLQKQHQVVVSGNSGAGKSAITLQMATSLAVCPKPEDQIPVLWIPLEMNEVELSMRQLSFLTGINNNKIQRADFTREEAIKVNKALEMIALGSFHIKSAPSGTIDEILSIYDEFVFKHGIKVGVIDYMQLLVPGAQDKGLSREEMLGRASGLLKHQVAENMEICSLAVSQQNRQNFESGGLSSIEKVGGSYKIAQDADDFLIISAKSKEQLQTSQGRGNRTCFIDKRRGGSSDVIVDMDMDDNKYLNLRFTECMRPEELMGLTKGLGYEGRLHAPNQVVTGGGSTDQTNLGPIQPGGGPSNGDGGNTDRLP